MTSTFHRSLFKGFQFQTFDFDFFCRRSLTLPLPLLKCCDLIIETQKHFQKPSATMIKQVLLSAAFLTVCIWFGEQASSLTETSRPPSFQASLKNFNHHQRRYSLKSKTHSTLRRQQRRRLRSTGERARRLFHEVQIKLKYFLHDLPDSIAVFLIITMIVASLACLFGCVACIICCLACIGAFIYQCFANFCCPVGANGQGTEETQVGSRKEENDPYDDAKQESTESAESDDFEVQLSRAHFCDRLPRSFSYSSFSIDLSVAPVPLSQTNINEML